MSNLETIFSSVTDTLRGGVTTDVMTVIMSLIVIFLIMAAFLWIKEVLLNTSDESLERKDRSNDDGSKEFYKDKNSGESIRL